MATLGAWPRAATPHALGPHHRIPPCHAHLRWQLGTPGLGGETHSHDCHHPTGQRRRRV